MKTKIIREAVPTIGRDAGLTLEIMELIRSRQERELKRRARRLGILSVFSLRCWAHRFKSRRFILKIEELEGLL